MRGETLVGWGSSDPDDLAVVLCAALRVAGVKPRILIRVEKNHMTAIEVSSSDRSHPIAVFPMHPIPLRSPGTDGAASLLATAIDGVGAALAREHLEKPHVPSRRLRPKDPV